MNETDRLDCFDTINFAMRRTAKWRGKMASQYSPDSRNARAVDALAALATVATELTDAQWLQTGR